MGPEAGKRLFLGGKSENWPSLPLPRDCFACLVIMAFLFGLGGPRSSSGCQWMAPLSAQFLDFSSVAHVSHGGGAGPAGGGAHDCSVADGSVGVPGIRGPGDFRRDVFHLAIALSLDD